MNFILRHRKNNNACKAGLSNCQSQLNVSKKCSGAAENWKIEKEKLLKMLQVSNKELQKSKAEKRQLEIKLNEIQLKAKENANGKINGSSTLSLTLQHQDEKGDFSDCKMNLTNVFLYQNQNLIQILFHF